MTKLKFAPAQVDLEDRSDGVFLLRSPAILKPYAVTLCEYLEYWADKTPDRPFLAERSEANGWNLLNYHDTRNKARSIAQALLNRNIACDRPIMIISENSIDHALLMLASLYAGVPVAPISPPYALMSGDFGKLKHVFGILNPSIVYVPETERFSEALKALDLADVEVLTLSVSSGDQVGTLLETLYETKATDEVDAVLKRLTADTIAKILFTSGSTGMPKGVINTHKMLCSNQQALAQIWPFMEEKPPVLVDWLPWSHTFGANHNFNLVLRNGGALYIDGGKPVPGLIETTVANLKSVAPSIYFNVPRGYDQLIPFLEADAAFRDHFFSRLDTAFYAAAALPQNLWERMEALSIAARGEKIPLTSAWGSTETAPLATGVHYRIDGAGVLGLPVPGTELKMIPNAGKLEVRVRGPNITPGYYRQPDLTRAAFDEEGFYRIGDAVKLADAEDPTKGLIFDGRIAEDFKLLTGSWVSAGTIRVAAISAGSPLIQDAVVTGHDRDEVGLLVFPDIAGLAEISGLDEDRPITELAASSKVKTALKEKIAAYNQDHPASSQRIARLLLMDIPPQMDANEITDKGYINQRSVIENRMVLIEQLYSDNSNVIIIE